MMNKRIGLEEKKLYNPIGKQKNEIQKEMYLRIYMKINTLTHCSKKTADSQKQMVGREMTSPLHTTQMYNDTKTSAIANACSNHCLRAHVKMCICT